MPGKKHVIAVSGGLGTGIDIVLGMLRRLGYQIEDADEIARCLTLKGSFGYQQIVERLGSQFLDSRGELDRAQDPRKQQAHSRHSGHDPGGLRGDAQRLQARRHGT